MSTHNIFFERKYENYQNFSSESFHFFFCRKILNIYLNRRVFVMVTQINK